MMLAIKKFKPNPPSESSDSLLSSFIRYIWETEDGPLDNHIDVKLTDWLKSVNVDVNRREWYLLTEFDIRTSLQIDVDNAEDRESARDLNNKRMYAKLAFNLRNILQFLINCHDDVNYKNDQGNTIFHVMFERFLPTTKHFAQKQSRELENLMVNIMVRLPSIFAVGANGKTSLEMAVIADNKSVVDVVINHVHNAKECDAYGNTALHILMDNCVSRAEHKPGYIDLVRVLIEKGADIQAKNNKGVTPIYLAAAKYHIEILRLFEDKGGDFRQRSCEQILRFLCRSSLTLKDSTKMKDTIDFLMSKRCNVNARNEEGYYALHYASEFASYEVVEKLIQLGADVNCQTRKLKLSPLHLAAKNDQLLVMTLLVDSGADVNCRAIDGVTPIFMAVLSASMESIQYLIDVGADVQEREHVWGLTLLHLVAANIPQSQSYAISNGIIKQSKVLKITRIISYLKYFEVDDPASCGITPLQLASMSNNVEAVKILIERGAEIDYQKDRSDFTALHFAASEKNVKIVEILLEAGADINRRGGCEQFTPLHLALMKNIKWTFRKFYDGSMNTNDASSITEEFSAYPRLNNEFAITNVIRVLIKRGADVNAQDSSGKVPLHFAALLCQPDIAVDLLNAGAYVNVQDHQGQLPIVTTITRPAPVLFRKLLNYGADVNDPELIYEVAVCDSEDIQLTLISHAIKLKMLKKHVDSYYDDILANDKYRNYKLLCEYQISIMKKHQIGDITICDFLQMDPKRQCVYVDRVVRNYDVLRRKFALYFAVIQSACREAVNRKKLLDTAVNAWYDVCPFELDFPCVETILQTVCNRYLHAICVSGRADDDVTAKRRPIDIVGDLQDEKYCIFVRQSNSAKYT